MVKLLSAISVLLFVAACSSNGSAPSVSRTTSGVSTGPVGSACLAQNRKGATQQRCGCIQQVADRTLTKAQQKRSVQYFKNPALLQDVRQSSAPSNEKFWAAWKGFAETSEALCATA